jgi:hypothetical protein
MCRCPLRERAGTEDEFSSLFQVKHTFRTPSWWDHHETWKDMRYDWLPSWEEIPKHLHERPHLSHLEELQVPFLLDNI